MKCHDLTTEGPKVPSEARRREAPERRWGTWGPGEGQRRSSPV